MDANKARLLRASRQAAVWWLRLQAGELSAAQRKRFAAWLKRSPLHVAEWLKAGQVHDSLASLRDWDEIVGVESHPVAGRRHVRQRPRTLSLLSAAAVIAFLAVAIAWIIWPNSEREAIATAAGESRQVKLDDGSVIHVAADTRLLIHYAASVRDVRLEQGMAVFTVSKDPLRPFIVSVDQTRVRAVGTEFGVEREQELVKVTVSEGTVAVDMPPMPSDRSHTPGRILLTVNHQLTIGPDAMPGAIERVDSGKLLAWVTGRLVFENEPVVEVVKQFNKHNKIQLSVQDREIQQRRISGMFDASDPEAFVSFLRASSPLRVERIADTVIVTRAE